MLSANQRIIKPTTVRSASSLPGVGDLSAGVGEQSKGGVQLR